MERDEFMVRLDETLQLAVKVKAALRRTGKTQGWTKCPRCGGRVVAVLRGHKLHLHMACATPNCIRMME